jgi:hypothetical protein
MYCTSLQSQEESVPSEVKHRQASLLLMPLLLLQIERDFSAEQSSLVNKAYSTLVRPLSRAIYLVSTLLPARPKSCLDA